ncbi:hypothetical protein [Saccharicrinis sp. FJH54]|uniref:hypothetical protein n=1 Tax=Saccharicrinis sp. FJH54 TaxID=3344665 RepID=UPI0035D50678
MKSGILYPTVLFLIILVILVSLEKISLDEIYSNFNIWVITCLAIIGISVILLFEYLIFAIDRKIIIGEKEIKILKKTKIEKTYRKSDIEKLIEYGETFNFHYFPWSSFKYGVLNFNDGSYYILNCLQFENMNNLVPNNKYEKKRNLFPSITLYHIYRFFADRD